MTIALASACANTSPQPSPSHDKAHALPDTPVGTPHDFDFEHGRWHTTLRRLLKPLSGSDQWADYTGTSNVHSLMQGRANLVELDVTGPQGRIQGVSLRLFDTERKRWTLNFSNVQSGALEIPMSGGFANSRRGVFYSAETFKGQPIIARFVVDVLDDDNCRFEQAFSADGGATWEVNWIALDRRIR
jgi:hypothetical protein